ncbi:hypothetical protein JHK82_054970 [Glycine max]|nr:hypothetical protein JHK86_054818 [Glycine max]KAG4917495.1 hypothetical protein JHK85_055776 [Glycine max]KAG5073609.1 hypothetical protein JHK84_054840 [Glycine max]KAG5076275.1 hypothetical protein JHK82_054970 [Glycine max]
MLDEVINYVQSLQRQVEFLCMKLAFVNNRLDFSVESLMSKDILQSINSLAHPIFPIDSSAPPFNGQHPHPNPTVHNNIPNGTMTHNSVDPLDKGGDTTQKGRTLATWQWWEQQLGSRLRLPFAEVRETQCEGGGTESTAG